MTNNEAKANYQVAERLHQATEFLLKNVADAVRDAEKDTQSKPTRQRITQAYKELTAPDINPKERKRNLKVLNHGYTDMMDLIAYKSFLYGMALALYDINLADLLLHIPQAKQDDTLIFDHINYLSK